MPKGAVRMVCTQCKRRGLGSASRKQWCDLCGGELKAIYPTRTKVRRGRR